MYISKKVLIKVIEKEIPKILNPKLKLFLVERLPEGASPYE